MKLINMGEVKLNFVLIGKTGQGKSAIGNSLLNRRCFKTSYSALVETQKADFSVTTFGKYLLLVVDTPGYDIYRNRVKSKETTSAHMGQALAMCAGNIDVFLFVFKFGNRFTEVDKSALDLLENRFGPSFLNHVIVVITGGDLYHDFIQEEGRGVSFHEWCQQQSGVFNKLYKDCKGRFVLFNNKDKDEEKKRAQIQEIILFADGLRVRSNRYTIEHFQETVKQCKKLILELRLTRLAKRIQEQTNPATPDTVWNKEVKLNLLLMGMKGDGKSATGNSLLNRNYFKTSTQTKNVSCSFAQFEDYILRAVDGPGLADTALKKMKYTLASDFSALANVSMSKAMEMIAVTKNMNTAIDMCYGGVDAFLFVTKFGQIFTAEDMFNFEALNDVFGPSYLDHVIVVVTCGDLFQRAMEDEDVECNFHEWCKQQTGEFKKLYEVCKGRFVLFNNMEKNEEKKREQIQEIVQLSHDLQKRNGRYTSQCFKDANRGREKLIVELKAPQLTLDIQETVSFLTEDIENLSQRYSVNKSETIIARVEDLIHGIDFYDKGFGVLDDVRTLVQHLKVYIGDVVEQPLLARILEDNRKAFMMDVGVIIVTGVIGVTALIAAALISTAPIYNLYVSVIAGSLLIVCFGAAVSAVDYITFFNYDDKRIKQKQNEIKNRKELYYIKYHSHMNLYKK